jgi:hypothetical protein
VKALQWSNLGENVKKIYSLKYIGPLLLVTVQMDRDEGMETQKLLGLTSEEAGMVEMGRWRDGRIRKWRRWRGGG